MVSSLRKVKREIDGAVPSYAAADGHLMHACRDRLYPCSCSYERFRLCTCPLLQVSLSSQIEIRQDIDGLTIRSISALSAALTLACTAVIVDRTCLCAHSFLEPIAKYLIIRLASLSHLACESLGTSPVSPSLTFAFFPPSTSPLPVAASSAPSSSSSASKISTPRSLSMTRRGAGCLCSVSEPARHRR